MRIRFGHVTWACDPLARPGSNNSFIAEKDAYVRRIHVRLGCCEHNRDAQSPA